jgi:uncharacterized protein YycO
MNIQKILLNLSTEISPIISHIHLPYSRKLIKGSDFRAIEAICKPGHIILSTTRGEMSNLFIPGFWSHAGMISVDGKHVVEARTKEGVTKTDLAEFCFVNKDYICLIDPILLTSYERVVAAMYAETLIGTPYDFAMSMSEIKKLYCSEVVFDALNQIYRLNHVKE